MFVADEAGSPGDVIESAVKDLEQATHALSKHMYEAASKASASAQSQPAGNGHEESGHTGDNVIDAEFEKT